MDLLPTDELIRSVVIGNEGGNDVSVRSPANLGVARDLKAPGLAASEISREAGHGRESILWSILALREGSRDDSEIDTTTASTVEASPDEAT
jgi:hypothetical protein